MSDFVFIPVLNERIKELEKKLVFSVSEIAPSTFPELKSSSAGSLVVYSEASDKTIYGDPHVNWIFRAYHDNLHLKYELDFSLEHEVELARICACKFEGILADVIYAESAGQVEYFYKNGIFPEDQRKFIEKYLNDTTFH